MCTYYFVIISLLEIVKIPLAILKCVGFQEDLKNFKDCCEHKVHLSIQLIKQGSLARFLGIRYYHIYKDVFTVKASC